MTYPIRIHLLTNKRMLTEFVAYGANNTDVTRNICSVKSHNFY